MYFSLNEKNNTIVTVGAFSIMKCS